MIHSSSLKPKTRQQKKAHEVLTNLLPSYTLHRNVIIVWNLAPLLQAESRNSRMYTHTMTSINILISN